MGELVEWNKGTMIELKKIDAQLKERLEGFLLMQLEV
jgi:hypothetical protein